MFPDVRIGAHIFFPTVADCGNQTRIRRDIDNNGLRILLQVIVKIGFLIPTMLVKVDLVDIFRIVGITTPVIHF
jgi:hypothetical protein